MKYITHKTSGVGMSTVTLFKPTLQVGHFLFECQLLSKRFHRYGYRSILIGEVALVEYFKESPVDVDHTSYIPIFHKLLSNVVDLSSRIFLVGIREKENSSGHHLIRSEADDLIIFGLPNDMELCFDENPGPLPNSPAYQLTATICNNVLWNDGEAFLKWLVEKWPAIDLNRTRVRNDRRAEHFDVIGLGTGYGVHLAPPNV